MEEVTETGAAMIRHGSELAAPRDKYSAIYVSLLLAGAGFILPYSSFIIAADYFQAQYPDSTIVFDLSLTYILSALTAVLMNNVLVESVSLHRRILLGYALSFFTLLCVTVLELWWNVFTPATSYWVNLSAVAVLAVGCTVQQSSFYGYASMLPKRYTQAVMAGESAAGVFMSVSRIITRLTISDPRLNTLLFFCCALSLVALCSVLHLFTRRSTFVHYFVVACSRSEAFELDERIALVDILEKVEASRSMPMERKISTGGDSAFQSTETLPAGSSPSKYSKFNVPTSFHKTDTMVRIRDFGQKSRYRAWDYFESIKRGVVRRAVVVRQVWHYMLAICVAYTVTLSLFPGIESGIQSCNLGTWMPVILMAIFNCSDFTGKILASMENKWSRGQLVGGSLVRILLIPPLLLCAAPRAGPVLGWEGWSMAITLLLGLSNGLVGSLPMILAPNRVADANRELCGNVMMLSYSLGLTVGSLTAYGFNNLLGPTGPSTCADDTVEHLCHGPLCTVYPPVAGPG